MERPQVINIEKSTRFIQSCFYGIDHRLMGMITEKALEDILDDIVENKLTSESIYWLVQIDEFTGLLRDEHQEVWASLDQGTRVIALKLRNILLKWESERIEA